ncbi:MAG: hypothetical protein EA402_10285 [Planctomycetota bacterium]|nr:MAG: hypothetical protein EA402_10285 [Planctomycetota bacterium]
MWDFGLAMQDAHCKGLQGGAKRVWKRNARFAGHTFRAKNTPFGAFLLADLEIGAPGDKLCAPLQRPEPVEICGQAAVDSADMPLNLPYACVSS